MPPASYGRITLPSQRKSTMAADKLVLDLSLVLPHVTPASSD
jgi:hypothetical protein